MAAERHRDRARQAETEAQRDRLLDCAPLEEQNAATLDAILGA